MNRRRSWLNTLTLVLILVLCLAACRTIIWQRAAALPRTNVLLLGLDRRPEEGTVVRSDTMILMTVNSANSEIALLSIPRDLYVEIPGHGPDRINTAHFWGESESEGNGPTLAMQTVAQNFGLPVHRYVRVDFDGFRAIVDAVGGIDIFVDEPVVDDAYPTDDYGTIRIEIPSGLQHMDGETALRYARTRHSGSDFDRVERQQQVLVALAQRLHKPGVWLALPLIYNAVASNVDTDMMDRDLSALAVAIYRSGPESIDSYVIDHGMTQPSTTANGGAVLLPRWEEINPLVQEVFAP
jgi:LCP family protein required for cell wall assembly